MLDIEFLLLKRNSFKHSILYECNSAVYKREVILRIKKIFEFKGFSVDEVDYKNFSVSSGSTSIFGRSLMVVDLNKFKVEVTSWEKELEIFLKGILEKTFDNRFLIICRVGDNIENLDCYKKLVKECYYISEPELNKTSIDKVIKYLIEKNKNIFNFDKLKNKGLFFNSIKRCLENPEYNILSFSKFFEKVILLCVDENTFNPGIFSGIFKEEGKKNYYILYRLTYNFLINTSDTTRKKLCEFICNLHLKEKCPVKLILYRLTKIIKEFSFMCKSLSGLAEYVETLGKYQRFQIEKYDSVPMKALFNFSILYIQCEADLNMGNFIYELDKFLKLYEGGVE